MKLAFYEYDLRISAVVNIEHSLLVAQLNNQICTFSAAELELGGHRSHLALTLIGSGGGKYDFQNFERK